MKKILLLFPMAVLLLISHSCDQNTDYLLEGGVKSRILDKYDSAGATRARYFADDFGKLQNVKMYNKTGDEMNHTFLYDGVSADLNTIWINKGNTDYMQYTVNLDTAGKIILLREKTYTNSGATLVDYRDSDLAYASGKLYNIFTRYKTAAYPVYTLYHDVNLEYFGENISKITVEIGPMLNGLKQPPQMVKVFEYSDFDSNYNPYQTISPQFNIARGVINTPELTALNKNNYHKMKYYVNGVLKSESPNYSITYDKERYPTAINPGSMIFIYNAIESPTF